MNAKTTALHPAVTTLTHADFGQNALVAQSKTSMIYEGVLSGPALQRVKHCWALIEREGAEWYDTESHREKIFHFFTFTFTCRFKEFIYLIRTQFGTISIKVFLELNGWHTLVRTPSPLSLTHPCRLKVRSWQLTTMRRPKRSSNGFTSGSMPEKSNLWMTAGPWKRAETIQRKRKIVHRERTGMSEWTQSVME